MIIGHRVKASFVVSVFSATLFACSGSGSAPGTTDDSLAQGTAGVPGNAQSASGASSTLVKSAVAANAVRPDGDDESAVCSDADVAAIVTALNVGEIKEAKAVLDRVASMEVKDFARRMISDHTALQARADQVLAAMGVTPRENDLSRTLSEDADDAVKKLSSISPPMLDRDYIAHEVIDHLKALAIVDHLAIPAARDARLRAVLREASIAITLHYVLSLRVQRDIAGACGSAGTDVTDAGCGDAAPTPSPSPSTP